MIRIVLMFIVLLFSIIVYLFCRKFRDKLPIAITLAVVSVMALGFSIYNGVMIEKNLAAAESQVIEKQIEEEVEPAANVQAEAIGEKETLAQAEKVDVEE